MVNETITFVLFLSYTSFFSYANQGLFGLMFFLTFSCIVGARSEPTYNVMDYGAVADGQTNDTQAFLVTWNATCEDATGNATFLVPYGKTFLLDQVEFQGPCKSYVHVQVDGEILRPNVNWGDKVIHWITFHRINGLLIDGCGEIDGRGDSCWPCKEQHQCDFAPNSLAVLNAANVELSGLRFVNSSQMHVVFGFSSDVMVHHLNITAPGDSPDGVHVEQCERVQILNSSIATGDDCISLGNGTISANVSGITCGPGHGISIGSLGIRNTEAQVEKIDVRNSTIFNTTNGVRIKSWQGGSGYARGIVFENIELIAALNPIIIDQYYCPSESCSTQASAVNISDVQFIGITGTSRSEVAITLNCSRSVPCQDILMRNVSIQAQKQQILQAAAFALPVDTTYQEAPSTCTSHCQNIYGEKEGIVVPDVPCLEPAKNASFPFFH